MDGLLSGFEYIFAVRPMLLIVLGTALGIVVGAIPGLTGVMLISLTLPLTYGMSGPDALVLLVAMYVGAISGGLITATLMRMPGTPASVITTLDGFPLARRGRPGRALGLGITASLVGGLFSWVVLITLTRPLARLSVQLGPFEFLSLVMVALVVMGSVAGRSVVIGLLSGGLGILASIPGTSPATGEVRFTFGLAELDDGLKLLPVLIGLFAVAQVLREVANPDRQAERVPAGTDAMLLRRRDWKTHSGNLLRSSLIGTGVGILPGIGANIGSLLAYAAARGLSKSPQQFGEGSEEGIIASEAANNATVGGALIPLIALGIPGSLIDAVLLGALVLHGLQPGPLLFDHDPLVVYTIMATMLVANLWMFVFMLGAVKGIARLVQVPNTYLIPVILVFCVVGSYALSSRMFDVWVMLLFGLVGLGMEKLEIPVAPFVMGFVLAPLAEESLGAAWMLSGGSLWPMVTRPVSLCFCLIAVTTAAVTAIQRARRAAR